MTNEENGAWEESVSGWEQGGRPPTDAHLERLRSIAQTKGRRCVVGALIRNSDGCVFIHRRSEQRRTWPGRWDIVGGHVEEGESLCTALAREIYEETGWTLVEIVDLLAVTDWRSGAGEEPRREFDFLVEVEGDLSRPRLEPEKHTEYRWLRADETVVMKEERAAGDTWLIRVVELAFQA
jgi:8-oxo-dGTP pyrophosphatase MutT (NUDIX family)